MLLHTNKVTYTMVDLRISCMDSHRRWMVSSRCIENRSMLFPLLEGGRLNISTPTAPPEGLYNPIIGEFDDAIADMVAGRDPGYARLFTEGYTQLLSIRAFTYCSCIGEGLSVAVTIAFCHFFH